MRPLLLTLLLQPFIRISSVQVAARKATTIPVLSYPACTRNFTCAAPPKQDFQTIMSDLKKEEMAGVERLAEPAAKEAEIPGGSKAREEAVKAKEEEQEKGKEEVKLPKLSAADFKTYNSLAERMEYFVRLPLLPRLCTTGH
jgi:hypothetical protein